MTDGLPESRAPKLPCKHNMCFACLKRIFTMSVKDPQHMPPKCCNDDCIPLRHIEARFDTDFKRRWNRKYQEYTTANRLYCPTKGCGAWIPPRDIKPDPVHPDRKAGRCPKCRAKVCARCNGRWHPGAADCPTDPATRAFAALAHTEGWQRCYHCNATVELKEGCNHMTCRCGAEFCMLCGEKWKGCDCPWFSAGALLGGEARARQQREDAALAWRMQGMEVRDDDDGDAPGAADPWAAFAARGAAHRRRQQQQQQQQRVYDDIEAIGNAAAHFMNDHYVPRAAGARPPDPAQAAAIDRLADQIRREQHAMLVPPDAQWAPRRRARPGRADLMVAAAEAAEETEDRPAVDTRRMAGLNRRTAEARVHEWRQHVE